MENKYPNDSDGGALQGVARSGSDMSKPMVIDFQIAIADEISANALAIALRRLGYHARVYDSPDCKLPWTCQCSTRMLATYEGVIAIQEELAIVSLPFGGIPDGWGTFGNGPNGQPDYS